MTAISGTCLPRLEQELPQQQFNTWIKTCGPNPGAKAAGRSSRPTASCCSGARALPAPRRGSSARNTGALLAIELRPGARPARPARAQRCSALPAAAPARSIAAAARETTLPGAVGAEARHHGRAARGRSPQEPAAAGARPPAAAPKPPPASTFASTRRRGSTRLHLRHPGHRPRHPPAPPPCRWRRTQASSYSPLFVYGGVGRARPTWCTLIGNAVFRHNRARSSGTCTSRTTTPTWCAPISRRASTPSSATTARSTCWIIDDIQFFNNKNRTQEEFFHAFNALTEARKQIVITCDTYPRTSRAWKTASSRASTGASPVQIEPPGARDARRHPVKKKRPRERVLVDDDVAFLIAKNLRSNVRELEGALNKVVATPASTPAR